MTVRGGGVKISFFMDIHEGNIDLDVVSKFTIFLVLKGTVLHFLGSKMPKISYFLLKKWPKFVEN